TAEVISTVSRRAISAYHHAMYMPGNVVVAAAGNLDHNKLVRLLEQAERKAHEPPARGRRVRPPLVKPSPPSVRFMRKDTEQYHLCLGAPGIAPSVPRRLALSLL